MPRQCALVRDDRAWCVVAGDWSDNGCCSARAAEGVRPYGGCGADSPGMVRIVDAVCTGGASPSPCIIKQQQQSPVWRLRATLQRMLWIGFPPLPLDGSP